MRSVAEEEGVHGSGRVGGGHGGRKRTKGRALEGEQHVKGRALEVEQHVKGRALEEGRVAFPRSCNWWMGAHKTGFQLGTVAESSRRVVGHPQLGREAAEAARKTREQQTQRAVGRAYRCMRVGSLVCEMAQRRWSCERAGGRSLLLQQ